jgi:hypothetical protein
LAIFFVLIITTNILWADANQNDPNDSNSIQPAEKPIIIWYHSGEQNDLSLKTALSSGLITHVIIKWRNPADGLWHAKLNVREAIKTVKKSGAKLIWGRDLWARWIVKNAKAEDLFDTQYYIKQILLLRAEAKEMGADFVFLDTEAYGNSPMIPYMQHRIKLTDQQHEQLEQVIEKVIQTTGKIDFIAPAGWLFPGHKHPYDVLAKLGRLRIAENTYYDNPEQTNAIKYPYEIFGVSLNTTKKHERSPHNPHFLASEIFERSQLWSGKKGVYLYTSLENSLAIAEDLVAYSKTLPFRDSAKSGEPNEPNHP